MQTGTRSTGLMFLRSAIEKILADRDIKRKENLQLKKACESALEELKEEENEDGSGANGSVLPDKEKLTEADRFFLPFELACLSKSPRIVTTALDCLQKLIAYGHLTGRGADTSNPERLLIDRIVEAICSPFGTPGADEAVLLQIIKAILAVVLSSTCEVHEVSLLLAVKTCFNIYLATKSPINQATAKGTLTQIINTVFGNMERFGSDKDDPTIVREVVDGLISNIVSLDVNDEVESWSRGGASTVGDSEALDESLSFPNVHQKDAFLVFRALCILAQKDEGDVDDPRNTHLRSKLLALEMLLLVLQNSSATLQTAKPFIGLIKRSLCVTLSKNAKSKTVQVFEKSLAIFVQLLDKFKVHLKLQVEIFFKEVIINMLESTTCSFDYKWILLNTIGKILANPQSVVDLFVNYDCDLTAHNVFANLVDVVCRTSRTPVNDTSSLPQKDRERAMRLLGLSCLADLLQCLVDWFDVCSVAQKMNEANETGEEASARAEGVLNPLERIEHLKQRKDLMEHGIMLFGRKPKQGLKFLQDHEFVGKEAVEIAEFLMKEDRLDKTVVGDFLGDPNDFNKQVMYAYVDDFDFSSVHFVTALRMFLEKFRLPGEAQKIDRLMEKFASRYCECNPGNGVFASADTAYVLAYSVIMLTTDLHSAQVKNKMTKPQYLNMNRGINNEKDLPAELLESIYDDISKNEIKMKAGASKLLKSTSAAQNNSAAQKKALATLELEALSDTARQLMESASTSDADFTPAKHQHHVKPMFKICWTPCLAAFSVGLQTSDDMEEWFLCIRGFRLGVRAACVLGAQLERNAFMQALARFTLLQVKNGMAEMKDKNIEAIKLMLAIGDEDGDFLEENWVEVIKCLSQLELAQLIGTGLGTSEAEGSRQYVMKGASMDERTIVSLQGTLGETSSQAVVVAVDRIFHGSSRLSANGIVHFVTALCSVSKEELSQPGAPRMYLLAKIVEVAFYNMNRIRLEWRRIWAVVGAHFDMAGCNTNETVAHFSVDALRQLAIKFLEKGELPNFRFQKDFLRPFEVIVNTNRSAHTRELVVACCSHLVEAHSSRLKSGWLNLFSVWKKVAADPHIEIVEAAFTTASKVVQQHFSQDFASVLDSFQEAISCIAEFACNANLPDMSMDAIRLIRLCADYVSANQELIVNSPYEVPGRDNWSVSGDQRVWLRGWFPIFFELHTIINRTKLDVRTRSLTVMFDIMKVHGGDFRSEWWRDLFVIVFRIFDKAKRDDRSDKREWMMTTCNHALYAIVDVFTQYFEHLGEILLPAIYEQFGVCIQQHNEALAKSTVQCLETLILMNGSRFTAEMWDKTIVLFRNLFAATLPMSLLTWEPEQNGVLASPNRTAKLDEDPQDQTMDEKPKMNGTSHAHPDAVFAEQIVFCVVQSELVDAVTSIVLGRKTNSENSSGVDDAGDHGGLYNTMSPKLLLSLVEALAESQRLAKQFNDNNGQRTLLWKAGLRGSSKPNLIRQETHALQAILSILLRLLSDVRSLEVREEVAQGVLGVVSAALRGYGEAGSETRRTAYAPVVCRLLQECLRLPADLLPNLGTEFPLSLCELVETAEGQSMRSLLASLMRRFLKVNEPRKVEEKLEVICNGNGQ